MAERQGAISRAGKKIVKETNLKQRPELRDDVAGMRQGGRKPGL